MSNTSNWTTCQIVCWLIAAVCGLIVFWVTWAPTSFLVALMVGLALAVLIGLVLTRLACSESAAQPTQAGSGTAASPAAAPEPSAPAADAAAEAEPEAEPAAPAASETARAEAAPAVKSGTQLPGEEELAARKGEWKYQGGAAPAAAAASDGGAADEAAPETLAGPRDGQADDLKKLKGVGPKLEQTLNELGFFHFDQVAGWSAQEIAWVDARLAFKGRIERDGWVEQAKTLAAGGETEFAKRVDKGDVY